MQLLLLCIVWMGVWWVSIKTHNVIQKSERNSLQRVNMPTVMMSYSEKSENTTKRTLQRSHVSTVSTEGLRGFVWTIRVNDTRYFVGPTSFLTSSLVETPTFVIRDELAAEVHSLASITVSFQSTASRTYLSRDGLFVVADKLESKSAEKWRLSRRGSAFYLFGVASNFQVDGGSLCVALRSSCTLGMVVATSNRSNCAAFLFTKMRAASALKKNLFFSDLAVAVVLTLKPLNKLSLTEKTTQISAVEHWISLREFAIKHGIVFSVTLCVDTAAPFSSFAVDVKTDCEVHPAFLRPTYRGIFAAGENALRSAEKEFQFVLFCNADVIFPASDLALMLDGSQRLLKSKLTSHLLVSGRRRNCPSITSGGVLSKKDCDHWSTHGCTLFSDDAQDYFLISKGALKWSHNGSYPSDLLLKASSFQTFQSLPFNGSLHVVPPMVVGGIAFDNWLVSTMATLHRSTVIDASATVRALHFGRVDAGGLYASHRTAASSFNSEVAHYCGGWSLGKLSSQPFVMLPLAGESDCWLDVTIHQRKVVLWEHHQTCRLPYAQRRPSGTAFDGPWVHRD